MTLANMRREGVRSLIAYCLNDSCRHQALIDVSEYPGDTPVPSFGGKVVCAKCAARDRRLEREAGNVAGLDRAAGRGVAPRLRDEIL
jgi:hypothetical protein